MTAFVHSCPVCGSKHEVTRARAEMARGAQLMCSPVCEAQSRKLALAGQLKSWHLRTEAVAFMAVLALLGIVLVIKWA